MTMIYMLNTHGLHGLHQHPNTHLHRLLHTHTHTPHTLKFRGSTFNVILVDFENYYFSTFEILFSIFFFDDHSILWVIQYIHTTIAADFVYFRFFFSIFRFSMLHVLRGLYGGKLPLSMCLVHNLSNFKRRFSLELDQFI